MLFLFLSKYILDVSACVDILGDPDINWSVIIEVREKTPRRASMMCI